MIDRDIKPRAFRLSDASHIRLMIVKTRPHLHGAKERGHMRLLGLCQTGMPGIQNCLRERIKHPVLHFTRQMIPHTSAFVRCSFHRAARSDCSSTSPCCDMALSQSPGFERFEIHGPIDEIAHMISSANG